MTPIQASAEKIEFTLDDKLPPKKEFQPGIRRAPHRGLRLNRSQIKTALKNALRYLPTVLHREMAPEFLQELQNTGRIYGYRFRPFEPIKARPVESYRGKTLEGRALQVMIDNNLDFDVALYPYELVTYGESGQVFQNWMQYLLTRKYLQEMNEEQTLVLYSGHPLGLFPSHPSAPRVISTNGMLIGLYDNPDSFQLAAALGVSNYGQMTAGGWMYIGPQGIVHGTYITLLNAARLYLDIPQKDNLAGVVFVSSGLGGMSGAQPKAMEIAGGIAVIAEVDESRIRTRHEQGWVSRVSADLPEIHRWVDEARRQMKPVSIAYHGNVVDLLEYALQAGLPVDLLSDQTSCHDVYGGGYTPAGCTFQQGRDLIQRDPQGFKNLVDSSLRKHYDLIRQLSERGVHFWDYGNSFLKAVYDAGVRESALDADDPGAGFVFPSYVEDIMGPMCFDYGFGPFRWVCLSGKPEDLRKTDLRAMKCLNPERSAMDRDNFDWVKNAEKNKLVVGSQARILYADARGRVEIALAFNEMVRRGEIGPVMLGRDHHDVSGTDSPFRETANIKDGSNMTADMAVQNFVGDAVRGMSLVVLSNGGGVGIGKSINGGFGLVLDGSPARDAIIRSALDWDVMNGIARRSWAGNQNALETAREWNRRYKGRGHITEPSLADDELLDEVLSTGLKD